MKSLLLLAATTVLISISSLASDKPDQQETIKTIQDAVSKTNIFALPSFQMKAKVQIETQGKRVDGTYQLLWNGPDQWKEEIRFPEYTETQVGGKGTVWIQRSTDFLPLRIYQLHAALGFGTGVARLGIEQDGSFVQPNLIDKDHIQKVSKRTEGGVKRICFEYENALKRSEEVCLDDTTNTLIRSSSYVDSNLQPVAGGKAYPRSLSFVQDGGTLAKIEISEISSPAEFPAGSFVPPAGSSSENGCMNPAPFRLVRKVSPEYPQRAKAQRVQGVVALDVRVGVDGVPKIGRMVNHSDPDLERASTEGVKQWRYEPATCNGKPVEVETVVQVSYTLSISR
jgi:TonB family protein